MADINYPIANNDDFNQHKAESMQQIETLQVTKADKTYVDTQVASVATEIADKLVTPDKTTFLQVSTNLLDKHTFIEGYSFNYTTGEPVVNEECILSDFIKVKPNTMYYFKNILNIGRYDVDKNFINTYSPAVSGEAVNSYGAEYIRVSTYQRYYNTAQINEGEELPYEPYGVKLCSNIEIEDKNLIKMKQDLDKFKEDFIRQFPPNNIIKNEIKNGNFEKGYDFLLADNWSVMIPSAGNVKYNSEEKSQKIDSMYRDNHLSQAVEILGGNKYLLKFLVKKVENRDTEANLIIGFANSKTEVLKEFVSISDTQYNTEDYTEITILLNPSVNYSFLGFSGDGGVGSNAWLKNVLLINLTKTFGAGKEPSVAEFNTILDRFPDRWFDGVENIKTLEELFTEVKTSITQLRSEVTQHKLDYMEQFNHNFLLENLISNGDFSTGQGSLATQWSSRIPNIPLYLEYLPTEKAQKVNFQYHDSHFDQSINILANNIYFIKFKVKAITNIASRLIVGFANTNDELLKDYIDVEGYNTSEYTEIVRILMPKSNYSLIGFTGRNKVYSNAILKDVLLINLTAHYGVGKEPTAMEFSEELDKYPNRWFDGVEIRRTLGSVISENEHKIEVLRHEVDILNEKIITHSIKKKPILPLEFEQMTEELPLLGTAYDGNLYGVSYINGSIRKSVDGGITFTQGSFPNIGDIVNLTIFSDGSVVAISRDGKFAHSEGFDKPFTIVKETDATFSTLNFSSYDNGIDRYILASEYGHTSTMKKIWLSKDGGLTYSVLKEGDTLYTGNNHWHIATFDPYSGGIFASQGDGNNARLYFTPDFGITWNYIEGTQPTAIYPFPNRVIFGRDNVGERPGIYEWDRDEIFPTSLKDALTFREDRWSYNFYPSNTNWNNANPNEYYLVFPSHIGADELSYMYATGDGGESWHKVYENLIRLIHLSGIDKQGYVYAIDKDFKLYRAKRLFWEYDTV